MAPGVTREHAGRGPRTCYILGSMVMKPAHPIVGCVLLLVQAVVACGFSNAVLCHTERGRIHDVQACRPCEPDADESHHDDSDAPAPSCADTPVIKNQLTSSQKKEVRCLGLDRLDLPGLWSVPGVGGELNPASFPFPPAMMKPSPALSALRTTVLVV